MMSSKSGQAATEYLMVVALISIVIIPTTFLFYNYASDSAEEIDHAQIDKFGRDLVATAETVYYLGSPSKITIKERLPANVENISIEQDSVSGTYIFAITIRTEAGASTITFPTNVRISGAFDANDMNEGVKNVRIYSAPLVDEPFVIINFGATECGDGTLHDACSSSQPLLCYNGLLLEHCEECGCASGTCQPDGTCQ